MKHLVSAPGKAFLCGEYAVLDGAPALVAATRLGVTLSASPAPTTSFTSSLAPEQPPFQPGQESNDNSPAFALVRTVLDTLRELDILTQEHASIHIDSSLLHHNTKLGLGSSGAVAAGLSSMLAHHDTTDELVTTAALTAHHRFQNHVGSGSDVLASLHGGICSIRNHTATRHLIQPHLAIIPTDNAASTPTMVRAVRTWMDNNPPTARKLLDTLSSIADQAAHAAAHDRLEDLHHYITQYGTALDELTNASAVPIVTPHIRSICSAASAAGWAAKPSGAGGGDIVIAMAPPSHKSLDLKQLARALEPLNAHPITLEIADRGTLQQRRQTQDEAPA